MANNGINNTAVHNSTFSGGLNLDVNIDFLKPDQYRDALNVSITDDGNFFAVRNIKGTTEVDQLFVNTDASTPTTDDTKFNLLGVYSVFGWESDGTIRPSIAAIMVHEDSVASYRLKVKLYSIETDTMYEIFSKAFGESGDEDLLEAVSDGVVYSEAGIESLYFTDNHSNIYKIPMRLSLTPYNIEEVKLMRSHTDVELNTTQVLSGGNLDTGSYQFAIRYAKKDLNKYTEWNLLSSPIAVSIDGNQATDIKQSKVGSSSGKSIQVEWNYNTVQSQYYDYAEVAVIQHVDGTSSPSQSAIIVGPMTIASMVATGKLRYTHKSNDGGTPYDINEILIDDAAIKVAKTLAVKNNRLFLGGIEYVDLSYDTTPALRVVDTALIYQDIPVDYGTPDDNTLNNYKGYFRGEVYRFAVAFHDDQGNWGAPVPLDFSGFSDNYSSGGTDMKFPRRNYGTGTWTNKGFLFEGGVGSDELRAMGLKIGIDNIPDWAEGMVILRAKRIKDIIAQTPLVPSTVIQPAELTTGTPDSYPISYTDKNGTQQEDVDTQPPNPLGTISPKNFAYNYNKSILRDRTNVTARVAETGVLFSGYSTVPSSLDGSHDHYQTMYVHFMYPPELLYGDTNTKYDYIENDGEGYKIDIIDSALLKCKEKVNSIQPSGVTSQEGQYVDSNVHHAFYAVERNYYYYVATQTATVVAATYDMLEIKHIPYGDESTLLTSPRRTGPTSTATVDPIITSSVMDYSSLEVTDGTLEVEGYKPTPQECFVCTTDGPLQDITLLSYSTTGQGYTNSVVYPLNTGIVATNYHSRHDTRWHTGSDTAVVSAVSIANITRGLDDLRYGDINQYHEYISTGAYKDVSGLSNTFIDVWGGDCYLGLFTFKITDRTYSLPNAQYADGVSASDTTTQLRARWKRHYDLASGAAPYDLQRPVPVKGNSTTLSLWLESEINPASIDYNTDTSGFSNANGHVFALPDDSVSTDITIPYNYRANLSMSVSNDLKIWIPIDDLDRDLNKTKSRIAYSNVKIYNADIEGFDKFPALNFYDLDETIGALNKLVVAGDKMFSIQEYGYAYLPVDANIIETADATNLAVRSGEVIGIPQYINTNLGCQHQKTVIQTGNSFYFFDYKNKLLIKNTAGQEEVVSDKGLIDLFNDLQHTDFTERGHKERDLASFYDSKNRIYGLVRRHTHDTTYGDVPGLAIIFDEKTQSWTSRWCAEGTNDASIFGGVTDKHGELYLIGKVDGSTNPVYVSTMYTGNLGTFFGEAQPMYIKFAVNPTPELAKTFDSVMINSDGALTSLNIDVPTPSGTYSTGVISLPADDLESLYRLKVLRNASLVDGNTGQRMRGLYAEYTIVFPSTERKLNNVMTRYRPSNRGL